MKSRIKDVLQRIGLYSFARDVYRRLSSAHRAERALRLQFFRQLIRPGDLCFDVGANLGQTIESLVACGAKVVAVEPNPLCLPTLHYEFGRDPRVTLVNKAIGSTPGTARLHFTGTAATASLRDDWIAGHENEVLTEVITLGQLIASHGAPKLLKVDVEGFELEVFRGLDRPIPIIYFEMHARELGAVKDILRWLAGLGDIESVNAISEDHGHWLLEKGVSVEEFCAGLAQLPPVANVVVRMR
jgi:FkbM family methyltransferase